VAWRLPVLAGVIVLAGVVAYSNSLSGVLVFDDEPALSQNPNLGSLWPLTRSLVAPPDTTLSGRPVATLTFALDHALTGGTLWGYHATNLLIHVACSLLVFGLLRVTLRSPSLVERLGGQADVLAFFVALLFVVHPLQTGAVTYVIQRVEALMAFFYLATVYCAASSSRAGGRDRVLWNIGAVMTCALGMGTKEVMFTAPLMVALWDWLFAREGMRLRRPLYVGLFATWVIVASLQAGNPRGASVGFGYAEWPWWRYLLTQSEVILHYVRLAVFPTTLVLDYDWPPIAAGPRAIASAGIVSALLVATIFGVVRRHPLSFAGAWFFLILAPTSSILPIVTEVAAEHRMYLPLAAVLALPVLSVFAFGRSAFRSDRAGAMARGAGVAVMSALVLILAAMTYRRNLDYQSYDRIWSDTIAKRPENARARNNYATYLLTKDRYAEAEVHLRAAVRNRPGFPEAQANLGVALAAQGNLAEGVESLERALKLRPDYAEAHRNLGEAYAMQGRLGDAARHYLEALRTLPDDVRLLNRAAWILATSPDDRVRNGPRALALSQRAVALTGRADPASLDSLAAAMAATGDFPRAAETAWSAQRLAVAAGNSPLANEIAFRAAQYARGAPVREP
jgi:tetratricopeptide (TPR) repeat protein